MFTERFVKTLVFIGLFTFIPFIFLFIWKEPILNFDFPVRKEYFGQFGDLVSGVIGSLWALAGVILFYVALKEQREDFATNRIALQKQIEALTLQAEEFKLQRDEIEHTRTIYEEQSRALRKQQFESTFFALLNMYSKIVTDINGHHSCDYFLKQACHLLDSPISDGSPVQSHNEAVNNYISFYYANKPHLSHYFKSIYRLMKFVDDSNLAENDKFFYAKVVRSQLKEHEILLLFYNANTEYGKNFRSLIMKYNLFKHLPPISKMEFRVFDKPTTVEIQSNRLQYCDWMHLLLSRFINDMNDNKYVILSEERQNVSVQNNELDSIFELSTRDLDCLELYVLFNKGTQAIQSHLGFTVQEFAKFLQYLLYDALQFSLFKENRLSINVTIETDFLQLNISSRNRLQIITDAY